MDELDFNLPSTLRDVHWKLNRDVDDDDNKHKQPVSSESAQLTIEYITSLCIYLSLCMRTWLMFRPLNH